MNPLSQKSRPDPILTKDFDEPRLQELETYRRLGGYEGLKKALASGREKLMAEIDRKSVV